MQIKLDSLFKIAQKVPTSATSVYLAPDGIEVVSLTRKGKDIKIDKVVTQDIPRDSITGLRIKKLFQHENIKRTTITATLPEEAVMLRRFTMPLVPLQDRASAVKFEAKRHIPFSIDEVISNYHIIKEDKISRQLKVLFFAVKKTDINSSLSLFKDAGLKVERIEPISLALVRALTSTGSLNRSFPSTAIMHFSDHDKAFVLIVENGVPMLKREIAVTSETLETKEQLLNEIILSFNYYKREFPKKNISKIIVCGLREKPDWIEYLSTKLGIAIEHSLPLQKLAGIKLPHKQMDIAIGLAASRLDRRTEIGINLIPREMAIPKLDLQKIIPLEVCIAACIIGLIYLFQIPPTLMLKKDIRYSNKSKTTSTRLDLSAKPTSELKTMKAQYTKEKIILTSFIKNPTSWYGKLKTFAQSIPQETWITQLKITSNIIPKESKSFDAKGFTYTADSSKEIEITNEFAGKLKNNPEFMKGFKQLSLGTMTKKDIDKHEVVEFDIKTSDN